MYSTEIDLSRRQHCGQFPIKPLWNHLWRQYPPWTWGLWRYKVDTLFLMAIDVSSRNLREPNFCSKLMNEDYCENNGLLILLPDLNHKLQMTLYFHWSVSCVWIIKGAIQYPFLLYDNINPRYQSLIITSIINLLQICGLGQARPWLHSFNSGTPKTANDTINNICCHSCKQVRGGMVWWQLAWWGRVPHEKWSINILLDDAIGGRFSFWTMLLRLWTGEQRT